MTRRTVGLRLSVLASVVFAIAASQHLYAKGSNSKTTPVHTTVCAIVNHPERFNGRIVRIQGNVALGFESFTLNDWSDASCSSNIELDYPDSLHSDPEFAKFMNLVGEVRASDPIYHPCNGDPCFRYTVAATITGKVQYGFATVILDIRSVSNVVATESDAEPSQAATLPMAPLPVFPVPASQRTVAAKNPCVPEILAGSMRASTPRFDHDYLRALETLPIVSFQVLESGEVANVHLKQSSRDAEVDGYMLEHVNRLKFKSRPGCGVFQTEMVINPNLPAKE